ncbi:MAG: helicase RepA family protein [Alphaproteobacteria bacterium]|nr:helicase RepA family protein [Alphaproteobacteria bacterium]
MQSMDFNDLHQKHGLQAVKDSISNAFPLEQDNKKKVIVSVAWAELKKCTKREHLVKKLLDRTAMSVVFGESNCGKSFLLLDLAIHVALGSDWCGYKVRQGTVIYIAAEGGLGIEERLEAFRLRHGMKGHAPLRVIHVGINLCTSGNDTLELIKEIQKHENVVLVVIDTLSRAMSGGNENSSEDMGAFIINCDRIREITKAHISIIHHSGKESGRGARGHSSLRAAVDTEIEVTKSNNIVTAEVKKQRDKPTGSKFHFSLDPVEIGKDEDGEAITSCVLIPTVAPANKPKLSGAAKLAFDVLEELIAEKGEEHIHVGGMPVTAVSMSDFREALKTAGISSSDKEEAVNKAIKRAIGTLEKEGIILSHKDFVWIHGQGDK